ncbi:hypothetical protein PoB_007153500 [Plakobranchus ocellatus]|uniref:Uncharacterized protein n=1 Tax=Plakobranchus ocellatus TaxID=259542 RepID=A0AAV4DLW8_9GAST|nr:hypothetical protein PoB_007153500 [Plakobranchus ocellatus]
MKLRLDARTETLQPSSPNMNYSRQHSLEVDEYRRPSGGGGGGGGGGADGCGGGGGADGCGGGGGADGCGGGGDGCGGDSVSGISSCGSDSSIITTSSNVVSVAAVVEAKAEE